ncbi:hypothetical protein HK101_011047 [Irineochytrium annulatum]|nr:hypothetical protein HK101_011047 [Irineochytrium annulatum]
MEICDLLNQKQKGYPREAAFAILRNVNGRSQQAALNGLTLLDQLVKNCGYPFHLVLSTKEFLNELVRKFPERPTTITPTQYRILELIQQWNATLCVNSRYKDDFKHITDMYRLLSYKGYHFPGLATDSAAVLTPRDTLQTEEELEEQDRVAQGAKLQELLRIGTPAALEQANELMKVMAGYVGMVHEVKVNLMSQDLEQRPDYRKQVNNDLDKIETQVIELNDLLNQRRAEDRFNHDNNLETLYGTAKSSQSRIQKLISDGDDEERVGRRYEMLVCTDAGVLERLLELNDLINNVITKYTDFKCGKAVDRTVITPSGRVHAGVQDASPTVGAISLIDFDDSIPSVPVQQSFGTSVTLSQPSVGPIGGAPSAHAPAVSSKNPMDDIFGLDFGGSPAPSSQPGFGGASMGMGMGMGAGMGMGLGMGMMSQISPTGTPANTPSGMSSSNAAKRKYAAARGGEPRIGNGSSFTSVGLRPSSG